ncbi:MAG: putative pyridoxal phosphate-dependent deaminase [Labilithrix sp.]|nr:putative pyridoxal phosphate-dependent deaminase [Labilithrix sp.]
MDHGVIPAGRTRPLLFDALPDLAAHVAWLPLAHVPTPVEPVTAIGDWLGRQGGIFMKRDDLVSPLYGGNKVRRFEYVLADARARGRRRLVTVGGLASTQAMATALFGKALGFAVRVVLFDQPVTTFARETLRGLAAAGAELVHGGGYTMTALRAFEAARRDADENYFIFPGAAGPRANLGYVDAMFELAAQVARGEAERPDVIVLPTGSSGTLAALALGAAHLGWPTEIVGVRITSPLATNRLTVGAVIRATDRYLAARDPRWKPRRTAVRYRLDGSALGAGYGHPTADALEGAAQTERLIGASGEVTYSGKALAGLRAIAGDPTYAKKSILLWNTLSRARPVLPPLDLERDLPRALHRFFAGPVVA